MSLGDPRGTCLFDVARALHRAEVDRLTDVTVQFGVPNAVQSGDYLCIGADDLADPIHPTNAGSTQNDWAAATFPSGIDEQGSISCAAWVVVGSFGDDAALDAVARAEVIFNDCLDWVRSNNGVDPDEAWDLQIAGITAWSQWLDDSGQNCLLRFDVSYRARI